MKRNKVFILGKISEREVELLKKDLLDHAIHSALQIKNLNLTKEEIGIIARGALANVLSRYSLSSGNSLGEMVKRQLLADLRVEYAKVYPTKLNKVKWPDLVESKPFKKLLESLQKMKVLPKSTTTSIFEETTKILSGRQSEVLSYIYTSLSSVTCTELGKNFDISNGMVTREIKVIYSCLTQVLKSLEIEL